MKRGELASKIWRSHQNYLASSSEGVWQTSLLHTIASFFTPGPFYYYVIDSPKLDFDFVSESVTEILGFKPEELSLQAMVDLIHPDDMEFFLRAEDVVAHILKNWIAPENMVRYKITYTMRERTANGSYKLFLLQTITLKTTEDGALQKVLGIHTDISHITTQPNYLLSLHGLDGLPSFMNIDVFKEDSIEDFVPHPIIRESPFFSERELEVIAGLGKGWSTSEIAEQLHISPNTVHTHRKNVLKKSGARNATELVARCIRLGYI